MDHESISQVCNPSYTYTQTIFVLTVNQELLEIICFPILDDNRDSGIN